MCGRHAKRQQDRECAALSDGAGYFNSTMMVFDDAVGERKAEAGTTTFGGVERPENIG